MRVLKSRTAKLAALAGLVALVLAMLVAPAMAAVTINGRRGHLPRPAVLQVGRTTGKPRPATRSTTRPSAPAAASPPSRPAPSCSAPRTLPQRRPRCRATVSSSSPRCIGGVVPVVNLPGIGNGKLKLTGAVLADIYLGKITMWNNGAIKALNPGVKPPRHAHPRRASLRLVGHHVHLHELPQAVSGVVGARVGADKSRALAGRRRRQGQRGRRRARQAGQGPHRLRRVRLLGAVPHPVRAMSNKAGRFVLPSLGTFAAAAAGATWSAANGFGTDPGERARRRQLADRRRPRSSSSRSPPATTPTRTPCSSSSTGPTRPPAGRADATRLQYVSMPTGSSTASRRCGTPRSRPAARPPGDLRLRSAGPPAAGRPAFPGRRAFVVGAAASAPRPPPARRAGTRLTAVPVLRAGLLREPRPSCRCGFSATRSVAPSARAPSRQADASANRSLTLRG